MTRQVQAQAAPEESRSLVAKPLEIVLSGTNYRLLAHYPDSAPSQARDQTCASGQQGPATSHSYDSCDQQQQHHACEQNEIESPAFRKRKQEQSRNNSGYAHYRRS